MALRVDPVAKQESVRRHMQVGVPQGKNPKGGGEREKPLGGLEQRDTAQTQRRSFRRNLQRLGFCSGSRPQASFK